MTEAPVDPARLRGPRRAAGPLVRTGLVLGIVVWTAIGVFLALLPDAPGTVFGGDLGHVLVAAVLSFAVVARFPAVARRRGAPLLLGAALAGVLIEVAQSTGAVGRNVQVLDVVGDVVGVAVGWLVARLLRSRRARVEAIALATLFVSGSITLAGPVAAAPPVRRWIDCRGERPAPATVERRLSSLATGVPFTVEGRAVATEHGSRRATDRSASSLVAAMRCSERLAVAARVTPGNTDQFGPRRIVSISTGTSPDQQNLMVGIAKRDLVVRIRFRRDTFEELHVRNVFAAGEERAIDVRYDHGTITARIDGVVRLRVSPDRATLANWSTSSPLNVGNEVTDDRRFDGAISAVRVGV